MYNLKQKVAIVTGGASGIGLEISRTLARHGAIVHIFEVNPDLAEREADLINANGGIAYAHRVDVARQEEVVKKVAKINDLHPIGILVNNAGISHIGTVESTSEADLDKVYNVNIKGVYNCLHAVIPFMKQNGGGAIVNMASIAASVGLSDRFAYSMSKGAIRAITFQVAKDYISFHIRCNCISPARVHTPFVDGFIKKTYPGKEAEMFEKLSKTQPIGRMGKPEEIAALTAFLVSEQAAFMTGADYPIDGGFITLNN